MHEVNRKVSKEEMVARVSQMYSGRVKVKKCPNAYSLTRSALYYLFFLIVTMYIYIYVSN
jgi:hypothetical protein